MKNRLSLVLLLVLVSQAYGTVRVFIQETNAMATINYQCTAGEVVRAFALDVTVDRGVILGITNFFRGPSTVTNRGYGIYPASFRDNITVTSGTNADWSPAAYSPAAVIADAPAGTLPGLNSSGITLEFGALWDPAVSAAAPPASGTLCALQLSQTANVTVAPNTIRGGVVAAPVDFVVVPQFSGALVGPAIINASVTNGTMTVIFQDGELESALTVNGPWAGTGNYTGTYSEGVNTAPAKFFRVHRH
jgi:hypothetical protein